jgi:hypothetical protein
VEEFSEHLQKTTKAQLSFSGLIPSSNDKALNERIRIVNEDVEDYIRWIHTHKPARPCEIVSSPSKMTALVIRSNTQVQLASNWGNE